MTSSIPQLSLRDELFLLGHDDDTGQPHIHRQTLALGLAGAVLIDLFLAGRIVLDTTDDTGPGGEQRLRLHLDRPVGDLIADTALASIRYARPTPPLRGWLPGFAADLYDRTRAGLQAGGILRHDVRRRLGGLARTDRYLPTDLKWPVVARARLHYIATGRSQPDNHTAALGGLIATLGLTNHLYLADDTAALTVQLRTIAEQHHRQVRDIIAAVDAAVGDLATATYR
ncbi:MULTISPECIES: GPP34 family phosphoprotein [Micromonospora]|uniref:GPP34 family phosphoprotein n=1 Tax=Micromonospora solifontis TaxID=2487138 RepID=A0ABX9WF01_9ACTN|nr:MULTISPECIES: GPP34 family phosphoprotein [Micromonospora]NES16538.1 GPP34 family phosphoprotein [Micromonospora sp. PPF5-17B]NES37636.1 GPP34 family phosphoprotein [Micromonospora solifontis]NES59118.1 GPP34 family phosphoprotein [Micromonospora sp. PPF5-6]RNL98164.1 GPP34 family phosphoprotein [Micromonospora solifontis]